ncbi:PP2C family protein-serine/threonine phosphatase [Longimycelium tulufanense]|uniref:PP2C family protein-serine/threonine phosphatase n=1 Tax=Longimycelium tulufanense TaxID=907463 RepID=UPI0016672E94|nr:PP2C family protein-serine/threonine phosphatase [Longimycelium tulufanense]
MSEGAHPGYPAAPGAEPDPLPLRGVLEHLAVPVVLADGRAVRLMNHAARRVLPGLAIGDDPAEAGLPWSGSSAGNGAFRLERGGLRLSGTSRPVGSGWRVWELGQTGDQPPAPAGEQHRLRFAVETSRRLRGVVDEEHVARSLVGLATEHVADHAVVLLPSSRGRMRWWCGAARTMTTGFIRVRTIAALTRLLTGAESINEVPMSLRASLPWPELGENDVDSTLLAGIGAEDPGWLLVARRHRHTDHELVMLRDLQAQARAALVAARRVREQEVALLALENELLPVPPPEVPGVCWGVDYRPARGPLRVGGDFFDVHPRPEGAVLFLGDVSGNGAEAAALTGCIRSTLAALLLVEHRPARLLRLLNEVLLTRAGSRFATLVVGLVRLDGTAGLTLTLGSGGHPPPLVLRRDGTVEDVPLPGSLVGILPEAHLGEVDVVLAPGELCLLYSDGVTEARSGPGGRELFGLDRLRDAVAAGVNRGAAELVAGVRAAVDGWLGGRDHDDIAMLAVQASPSGTRSKPATG